ncbi:MAG: fimbrillin family protein [Bacteroidales bacterium]|nr:fimbrillin family protein [Bacteroidales bacterium]
MKRIITVAIAALALAACAKENVYDVQREITFEVASRIQTKATTGAFYNNGAFGTYAWYTATTSTTTGSNGAPFMVNEQVDNNGSVWKTVDHTFYWPKTGSIDFISYSPFAGTSNTAGTVPAITEDSITYSDYTVGNVDLMYADKVVGCSANVNEIEDNLAGGSDSGFSGVPTLFRHALAKISFKIKANFVSYTEGGNTTTWEVTVKNAKISGFKTTGDCALALNTDGKSWDKPETTVGSDKFNVWTNPSGSSAAQELIASDVVLTTTAQDIASASGYVLPQILADDTQKLDLNIHIKTTLSNGKTIEEDYITTGCGGTFPSIDLKAISTLKAWQMNENIVYTINIKPTAKAATGGLDDAPTDVTITFDPAVADWTTVDATATIQL